MTKLATSSGTILYEHEHSLYLVKKPAPWTATFLFVSLLLTVILAANGILQLFILDTSPHLSPLFGMILLGLGILCALISWKVIAYRKKLNARPVNQLTCICIIDLATNNLLDSKQHIISPLADVSLLRSMQLSSSSPKLQLAWPANTLTIVEGNPFAGGVDAVEKALILKGIKRK